MGFDILQGETVELGATVCGRVVVIMSARQSYHLFAEPRALAPIQEQGERLTLEGVDGGKVRVTLSKAWAQRIFGDRTIALLKPWAPQAQAQSL